MLSSLCTACDNGFIVKMKSVFGSVVVGTFQIIFCAEMYVNDVFLFFKNHFWHQHIKTIQKVQTALNFNKKKFKFGRNGGRNAIPNVLGIDASFFFFSFFNQN